MYPSRCDQLLDLYKPVLSVGKYRIGGRMASLKCPRYCGDKRNDNQKRWQPQWIAHLARRSGVS
jgi:hypothetical protein